MIMTDQNTIQYRFSASDLVKKSARQIRFILDKKEYFKTLISQGMIKGNVYQQEVVEAKNADADEMRATFVRDEIVIFYCHDMIKDGAVYEVKFIDKDRGVPDWYLQSSIRQVAFYKSMLMLSNGILYTPTFRVKEGYNKTSMQISPQADYYLIFGEDTYKIEVSNPEKIVDFYIQKARSIIAGWNDCDSFDFYYKWKEDSFIGDCFSFIKQN